MGLRDQSHPPSKNREDEWTGCLSVHCPNEVPKPPSASDFIISMAMQEKMLAQYQQRDPLGAWDGQDTHCLILFPDKVIFVETGLPVKEEIRSGSLCLPDGCWDVSSQAGMTGQPQSRQQCGACQRESP